MASSTSVWLIRLFRPTLEQWFERRRLCAVLGAQRVGALAGGVHGHAGVLALLVQREEPDVEVRLSARVEQALLDGVHLDPAQPVEAGILRRSEERRVGKE